MLRTSLLAFGLIAALGGQAAADECTPKLVASLDMSTERNGGIAITVTVDGKSGLMVIDTGSIVSGIGKLAARGRKLKTEPYLWGTEFLGGVAPNERVTIDALQIGPTVTRNLGLMSVPEGAMRNDSIGIIGPDLLRGYDVEIDFAAGKLNLFGNDHCPGNPVYWTHGPYTTLPVQIDEGHLIASVELDGKTVSAIIDTGADGSTIPLKLAKMLFGINAANPAMKPLGVISINGTSPARVYRYPFKTLTLQGVQVQSPVIEILDGERFAAGDNTMVMGVDMLRQFHLYISYKESRVYLTPAEQR